MIKAEKGNAVISGNIACVMKDVITILRGFRKGIGEAEGQDTADDLLRECVRLSFLPDEDLPGEEKVNREDAGHEYED